MKQVIDKDYRAVLLNDPDVQRNLELLKRHIRTYGIAAVADQFIPMFENNWKYLIKEGTLPQNGGRAVLDRRMRAMNRLRNCLISTCNDRKQMTDEELMECRFNNFTEKVYDDIYIISEILSDKPLPD